MSQNQVFLEKGLLSFLLIWAGKQEKISGPTMRIHTRKQGVPLSQHQAPLCWRWAQQTHQACCHFWFSCLSSPPYVKQGLSLTHLCIGTACHSGWCTIIRITSIQQDPAPSWALGRLLQEHTVVLNLLNIPILHMERI